MSTIFISHVEEDTALARELSSRLEAAGYSTWHYQRDTVPGAPYLIQIRQAIEECSAFVVLVSPKSLGSNQVTSEVVRAFETGKHFLPILSGIADAEFKERQPLWSQALSASTSIQIPTQGIAAILPRILDGLKALGVHGDTRGATQRHIVPSSTSHVPKQLADKILAARKTMEGERKQVTILFAEVAGFAGVSGKLDPEEELALTRRCLDLMAEEIHRYEGMIAQPLRNGVMALFGAPIAHEDSPQRALYAALHIRESLRHYADELKGQAIEFEMRIGLNTGLAVLGKIRDDMTLEYTPVGDAVDLASAMESLAEPCTIQLSDTTYRLTEGYFDFLPPDEIRVKGKKETVKAYQLIGVGRAKTRLGASAARGLTPFVGRQNEMEQLTRCYERVKNGQGQVAGIVGEAGVGKSRLLLQMREMLPQQGSTYLEGGCLHYGEATAYLPFLDILRSYFDINEGDRDLVIKNRMAERIDQLDPKLKGILPPLHDILSLKVEDQDYLKLDAPLKRMRIFEGIRDLIVRESQNRPLVLAVEDLHWIDKTSEELLGYLIGFLANTRILMVLLYRPEYSNPWTSKTYYSQIGVDQLPPNTSAEMVQAMLHEGKAAPDLQELILSRAAGNPLFMEELTRSLFDQGFIQRRNGHYVLTVKPSDIQVPDTVQGIIAARMDRLEEGPKQTMQVASVIGREFGLRLLQTVTGRGEEVKIHLLILQGLELIYQKSLFPESEYIFKHALTQDVAYNSLLLKRRKGIHDRIGKAIEGIYSERLQEFYEVLAHHYSVAENPDKAYHYLKLSGDKATRNYAKWEALAFYQGAIDLLRKEPDTTDNKRKAMEILLLMSTVMRYLAHPEGSLAILEEGERLARELGDDMSLAHFISVMSHYYSFRGDSRHGLSYAEECFREAEQAKDVDLIAATAMLLGNNYLPLGEYSKTAEVSSKAITAIETAGRQSESFTWGLNLYASLLSMRGMSITYLGDPQKGEASCEKGLRFATEMNDLYAMGLVECTYAGACLLKGDGRKGLEHAKNSLKYLQETQFLSLLYLSQYMLGTGYCLLGETEAARQQVEKARQTEHAVGMSLYPSMYFLCMGQIHLEKGDWDSARMIAEEGLESAATHGERLMEAMLSVYLGTALARSNPSQADRAEQFAERGIEIAGSLKVRTVEAQMHLSLGELYVNVGQTEKALSSLKKARQMCREIGLEYYLAKTEKAMEKLEG